MAWYNPTDPTQRNRMIGGLFALVAIVPFNMYVKAPGVEANAVVQERLESLEKQNTQAGVLLARGGGGLEERMALYERHVARLEQLIPGQEEVAALLDDIQSRARLVGIDVQSLDPEPSEPAGPYDKTGYAMTVVGEYHAVGRFLTEIASLSRIVTPVQVDISLYAAPQTHPKMVSPVQASFRIETYVLPDRAATLPPAELPGG
jgi:type IV pilus assembly protein PilO